MKKSIKILGVSSLILILVNAGSQESSIHGTRRQKVNFKGQVTTLHDKVYKVDNISIGLMYKQIPVYEVSTTNNEPLLTITTDPKKGIITRLDLAEIKEIKVPQPARIVSYVRKKGYSPVEYIEIEVISKDSSATINHYLIETTRKMSCDEINQAGPIEKEIPFTALKSLVIESYEDREQSKNNKNTTI